MIKAGDLKHKITFMVKSGSILQDGLDVPVWIKNVSVPAAYEPLRGRELFQAETVKSEISVRFRIRYRDGITSEMRILFDDKYFDIIGAPIDKDGRHEELEIMAKVVV